MVKLMEADDYLPILVIVTFLLTNFNRDVGIVYLAFSIADALFYYIAFDKKPFSAIPLERTKRDRWINLIWGIGCYVIFTLVTTFLLSKIGNANVNVQNIISNVFATESVLEGSRWIKLIVWGVLIPIIETRFFFRTLLMWGQYASGTIHANPFSVVGVVTSAFFGALFASFHFVAKGVTNNQELAVTFMFGFISTMVVLWFKEAIQAVWMHIITNTLAIMYRLGFNYTELVSPAAFMPILLIFVSAWLLMFFEIPLINKVKLNG